ncbi:MAG: elongation factor G [Clostridiales bacterium]|nr:MAG: elongation factor G [Clostridiales bacterium]
MQYSSDKIRNVCLLGHGGDGKTTLAEAMLYSTKGTDRQGNIADGTTVCDYDPEEIKRKISISTAIAPVEYDGYKINIIDTPGYFDFEGEVLQAVRAAETALIVVNAKDGIHYGTTKAMKFADDNKMPCLFFITKIDEENANFEDVFNAIKERYGQNVCPISVPIMDGEKMIGYVDLIEMKGKKIENGNVSDIAIPDSLKDKVANLRHALDETVAETEEELMEKFFAEEEFTADEIKRALSHGVKERTIFPVMCGSGATMAGVQILLKFIKQYTPAPETKSDAQTAAFVFKTIADPFVGKMSFLKIKAGTLKTGVTLTNQRTGAAEKLGHIFTIKGKKQTEVDELAAGDIGVVTKLAATATGDVLCTAGSNFEVEPIKYPRPCLSMAIFPVSKGDEEKIAQGIQRISEEDPTYSYTNNAETHEQIISGMGETHLDVLVSKLKTKFGVSVELKPAKVAYREAIRKKVKQQGKHKKQSGGHGQYGDVWIEFEPYSGDDLLFEEKIFGGSVPKNFHPAVEKGLKECALHGVLAGYPVVGLKATLVDGSYHDVDSSEMSFKMAASIAFKEGLKNANPTILEPIGKLLVYVPDRMMGDIIGDITKRRGQIIGMTPTGDGLQEVEAEVPMAEMATYAIDLRSMTRGRGVFILDFLKYADAPANVVSKVIEDAKKNKEEE